MKAVVPSPAGGTDALPRPAVEEEASVKVVLVVEDNPITRRLLRVALEIGGYDVLDAADAQSALAIAGERRPDLLVLDFVLPDMDGLELLAELRRRLKAEVPAVIVTGMVSRLEALRARHTTSTHFLAKPVEPSTLLGIARAQLARHRRPPTGRRLLVVDDEAPNRKLASVQLERAGYEVETVATAQEALQIARRRPPDVIVSDVMMPSMDGFSLCREARRDPALRDIPIILVSSAYVEAADRELAHQMGAQALVVRTPDLRDVASAVEEALLAGTTTAHVAPITEVVVALHRERLQVQLDRQTTHNDMLLRQAAIQATALSLMRGLTEVLAQPADVPQILGDVLAHCLDAAGLSTGLLYIAQESGEHRLQAQFGLAASRKQDAADFFGHPEIIGAIGRNGVPVAFASGAGLDADARDFVTRLGHTSVLVLPFVVLGKTYGALLLASDDHDLTDKAWLGFARSLALQFGQTVALGQSLKRLAESESRYRALVDQATDAMFVLDREGRVLEANQKAEALLGLDRDRIVGRAIGSFSASSAATAHAAFAAVLAAGGGRQDDLTLRRADGELVDVDFAISVSEIDGMASVLAVGRDVTQRNRDAATLREAQMKLRDSEQQYRFLFDGNPHAMYVQEKETFALLAVNAAMVRQYGYSREEFRGMTTLDIRPPEEVAAYRARYAESEGAHADGGTYYSDRSFKHRRKDGTTINVDIAASAMMFAGRPAWLILATDVTEKEVLQAQLVEAQKMEAVGQLAGGIAHDFNNLLGVITGYSELLARALPPDSRERKRADEIGHAADRAAVLTRQLLAFSRRQILQPRVLDLNGLVANVEKMLLRVISADIQIVTAVDPDLGRVRADAGQLEQVLMNLAINARDAMAGGGRLLIETRNAHLDEAYVRINPGARAGASVVLAVSDTGHGMSAETMSRIFEPFFTTKEEGKGTGLGLATVYGIVRQSGGTVSVSSVAGTGTTFNVYLPRVDDVVEADARADEQPTPGGSETILVVEDSDALRILVREILESVGYVVLDAASPDAALTLLAATTAPIALVLTDIVMPRISGRALARQITALRPETRIVFMSGYADAVLGEEGTLSPETPFLQKPFTTDALLAVIRGALDEVR